MSYEWARCEKQRAMSYFGSNLNRLKVRDFLIEMVDYLESRNADRWSDSVSALRAWNDLMDDETVSDKS